MENMRHKEISEIIITSFLCLSVTIQFISLNLSSLLIFILHMSSVLVISNVNNRENTYILFIKSKCPHVYTLINYLFWSFTFIVQVPINEWCEHNIYSATWRTKCWIHNKWPHITNNIFFILFCDAKSYLVWDFYT